MIAGHNSNEATITDAEKLEDLATEFEPTTTLDVTEKEDETTLVVRGEGTAFSTVKKDAEEAFFSILGEEHLEEPMIIRSYSDQVSAMPSAWQWNVFPDGTVEYESFSTENQLATENTEA